MILLISICDMLCYNTVQKMRDDGKDSYDIKKQEEVLQESYMMVPDSKNRMEKTFDTLSELIVSGWFCLYLRSEIVVAIDLQKHAISHIFWGA